MIFLALLLPFYVHLSPNLPEVLPWSFLIPVPVLDLPSMCAVAYLCLYLIWLCIACTQIPTHACCPGSAYGRVGLPKPAQDVAGHQGHDGRQAMFFKPLIRIVVLLK
jgi:hypothetical protein